jgi:hypothetical protein
MFYVLCSPFHNSRRKAASFQEISRKNTFYLQAKIRRAFCFGTRARNSEKERDICFVLELARLMRNYPTCLAGRRVEPVLVRESLN